MSDTRSVTAAALAIGDELLSGRTRDKNIGHLAELLTAAGIELQEVRIVPDERDRIVEALNALRSRYDYVFTSGGIGPTHDDITADAVAAAFGVECTHDAAALALLGAHYAERGLEFTEARRRMARMPVGAKHIDNPVSRAPGFVIGNVHVMAGVPSVFQAMLDNVLPTLNTGVKILSDKVSCPYGEGDIGDPLSAIAKAHPDVNIGSYPRFSGDSFSTEIVIRGRDSVAIRAARRDVEAMLSEITSKLTKKDV
ncbi:competence/damage-inducible protein A [Hoeflea sp. EC-HK425]|uniref:competence/damage-inducible protein A n=1 Tax=Hoeflea sp. EC-HK425 TaxID=2038388 RepID=UPI0012543410|nr:competence/damage-inducible protein A [Hoeflea sp. EC-HK425]VVT12182.1 Molybdenum cofactor synthesis domain-containing protein [Hoeflea sp. EC-HK425]|tara:strand:+ start:1242 stop:2003 length:762 start_codon:yes stop_codon:yes gene_type:complete